MTDPVDAVAQALLIAVVVWYVFDPSTGDLLVSSAGASLLIEGYWLVVRGD